MSQQSLAVHTVETLAKIVHGNFVVTWLEHFGIFRTYRVIEKHNNKICILHETWTKRRHFQKEKRMNFYLNFMFLMVQVKISQYWLRQVSTSSGNGLVLSGHNKSLPEPTRTTRTPAFWGYPPPPHDYPHYWIMLGPKSKQGQMTLKI